MCFCLHKYKFVSICSLINDVKFVHKKENAKLLNKYDVTLGGQCKNSCDRVSDSELPTTSNTDTVDYGDGTYIFFIRSSY